MSPTSSSVTAPTDTSSVAERDRGRITLSAPTKSSWRNSGGASSRLARAAARSAASRTSAAKSATTKPGVRPAISVSSSAAAGTSRTSTSSSCLRVVPSGSVRPSSRSHRSGARSRASTLSGTAEVTTSATPSADTALRSSARISPATGSAVAGSSASMSVINRMPPPWSGALAVTTALVTAVSRSAGAREPISGPSSSTSRRSAHTVRTIVALPTPAGPDTSTPRSAEAPRVSSSSGSSRASLSHSVSFPACTWAPLRSSNATAGGLGSTGGSSVRAAPASGSLTRGSGGVQSPQLTSEFGCTLTGPDGSTPVTVSSSEVQVMPTVAASAALACDVDVPGPRSRGSSETMSPTVITLPSSA